MSGWPTTELGRHLEFITSGSRGWSKYVRDTGDLFIRIQNVGRNQLMLDDVAYVKAPRGAEANRTRVRAGDILLSITADLGRTAVVPPGLGAAYINQHLALLRVRDFYPPFVSGYIGLGPGRHQLLRLDRVGVKSGLNFDDVRSLRLPLPPLPEQKRIAAILDKADEIRRKRQEAIRLTEELLRSAFLDMFGDPVTNPKGWEVRRLGDALATSPQIGTTRPATQDGTHAVVRVGELGDESVAIERCGRVSLSLTDFKRFRLVPGDLVLVRAIGSEAHLGKCSLFSDVEEPTVFDSHVMRLRLKPDVVLPLFLLHWLKSRGGRARFMRSSAKVGVEETGRIAG